MQGIADFSDDLEDVSLAERISVENFSSSVLRSGSELNSMTKLQL